MKVITTCTLKNKAMSDRFPGGLISMGTVFEGTEETLPEFILDELKLKRGTLKILPESIVAKSAKPKPVKLNSVVPKKVKAKVRAKATSLRAKLAKTEK